MSARVSWWAAVACGLLVVHYAAVDNWAWAQAMVAMGLLNLLCAAVQG
jgi:hypothetical protein